MVGSHVDANIYLWVTYDNQRRGAIVKKGNGVMKTGAKAMKSVRITAKIDRFGWEIPYPPAASLSSWSVCWRR